MDHAPLFEDIAPPLSGGEALWLRTEDGVRLRFAVWRDGGKGTVLVFPGRTEYVEKYIHVAAAMRGRGFACAILDWRGQGLSDRLLPDRQVGHIDRFGDFQTDAATMAAAVAELGLPGPHFILAHSMGGCIALRTLMDKVVPVRAAAFSGPMWGVKIPQWQIPAAWALGHVSRRLGQGHRYVPGTGPVTYVAEAPFEDNVLTSDPEMFALMKRQVLARPELSLGGPSLQWLNEAMVESVALAQRPSPAVPALTGLGTRERVVDPERVIDRMNRWPGGRLSMFEGAEHEIVMETAAIRERFFDEAAELFSAHCGT
ncbi:MAG: alpha/beta fold hydrolase [Pseudomonadota bacterium]